MRSTLFAILFGPFVLTPQQSPVAPAFPLASGQFILQENGCLQGCQGTGDSATTTGLCSDIAVSVDTEVEVSNGDCRRIPLFPAGAATCAPLSGCSAMVSRSWGIQPGHVIYLWSSPAGVGAEVTLTDPEEPWYHNEIVGIDCDGVGAQFSTANLSCDLIASAVAGCSLCPEVP